MIVYKLCWVKGCLLTRTCFFCFRDSRVKFSNLTRPWKPWLSRPWRVLSVPSDQFRSLLLRLLGHKDHKKIFDCVAKVEKHCRQRNRDRATAMSPYYRGNRGRNSRDFPRNPGLALSCFYCGKQDHFKRLFNTRKRDLAMQEKNGTSQSTTK